MVKEILILPYCDSTEHRGKQVDAPLEREVLDDEGTLRQVDVCRVCDEKYLAPARELAGQGVVPERRALPPGKKSAATKRAASTPGALPTDCNQCDYVAPTRGALSQHMRNQHGLTLRDAGLALPQGRRSS
jgi:hypothetical protein